MQHSFMWLLTFRLLVFVTYGIIRPVLTFLLSLFLHTNVFWMILLAAITLFFCLSDQTFFFVFHHTNKDQHVERDFFFQRPFACFTICHCEKALAPSAHFVNAFVCLPQLKQSFEISVIVMLYSQFHGSKWYSYQMCNKILLTLLVEGGKKSLNLL